MKSIQILVAILLMLGVLVAQAETREFEFPVDVHVDATGTVTSAEVIGETSPEFKATIAGLVRKWKFRTDKRDRAAHSIDTTLHARIVAEIGAANSAKVTATYLGHGPRYVTSAPPAYPANMMRVGAQGEFLIDATVQPDGSATDVRLHSALASGGQRAARQLADAAVAAIKQWRLQPERVDGKPVGARLLVPIKFTLQGHNARLKTILEPPADDAAKAAALRITRTSTHAVAVENSTGLELIRTIEDN